MLEPKYKSPLRKLVNFFEQSRNQWKDKYFQKKNQVKQLQNRVRYLEKTKQEWKQKAQKLKNEIKPLEKQISTTEKVKKKTSIKINNINDFEVIPFHHKYSVGHMMLFFSFVNSASSSLRGGVLSLEVVKNFFELSLEMPSWHRVYGY